MCASPSIQDGWHRLQRTNNGVARRMNTKDYGKMVHALFRDPETIHLTVQQKRLLHAAVGIAGEGGEVLDEIKKHCFTGKPFNRTKCIKEMGDVEFYLEAMRQAVNVSRETVLGENMHKLTGEDGRYASGEFSIEQALNRQDTEKK